jgi:hypothetical protein
MTLITLDELARGLIIGTLGGAAGLCTLSFPGSALWLLPASLAVGGCALTVPEVRDEVARAVPLLTQAGAVLPAPLRRLLPGATQAAAATPGPQGQRRAEAAPPAGGDLVGTLESTPHRLIIGHTRGGKTTLIHHMATAWAARGERVLVADPDAAPGLWPGCEVRGAGDDIAAIGELLTIVQHEIVERRAARRDGQREFAPLHLIIDEAQDVLPVLPGGLELFEDVARRGGKLGIRMTVGVQDRQVKTLGLEGKSSLLNNLQVADVMKGQDGQRVAVLRDSATGQRTTVPIPALPDPERLIVVRGQGVSTHNIPAPGGTPSAMPVAPSVAAAPDPLLASLLAAEVPPAANIPIPPDRGNTGVSVETPDRHTTNLYVTQIAPAKASAVPQAKVDTTERDAAYRAAGAKGEPFGGAYKRLGGGRDGAFAAWQEGSATRPQKEKAPRRQKVSQKGGAPS